MRTAQYYNLLLPYLEGGLDEAQRTALEARLAADPALAAEAAHLRRVLTGLNETAARTPQAVNAAVPADLWPRLRARLESEKQPAPAPASRPRAQSWWLAGAGASAAAVFLVAALWLPGWRTPELAPVSAPTSAHRQAAPPGPGSPGGGAYPASAVPRPAAPRIRLPAAKSKTAIAAPPADPFALPPARPVPTLHPSVPIAGAKAPTPPVSNTPRLMPEHDATRAAVSNAAPILLPPAAPAPSPPPALAPPPPAPVLNAPTAAGAFGGGGFGGAAAPAPVQKPVAPSVLAQAKSHPDASAQSPGIVFGQASPALPAVRRDTARRAAPSRLMGVAPPASDEAAGLDTAQAALASAVQPPLWGETAGEQQANQALLAVKEAGLLDEMRARLESRRSQSPRDLRNARMLAAVYDYGFSSEAALRERRRIAGLEGATGEDWFALAQSEERAGNAQSARAAYRHALEAFPPPSAYHGSIARQKR